MGDMAHIMAPDGLFNPALKRATQENADGLLTFEWLHSLLGLLQPAVAVHRLGEKCGLFRCQDNGAIEVVGWRVCQIIFTLLAIEVCELIRSE